jgi:hypothetical protein
MPEEARHEEIHRIASRLERDFTEARIPRVQLAREVNRELTEYVARLTGQRVHTSSELRDFTLAKLAFPFAMGVCDIVSGDVALFRDAGFLEPHVICHEFVHRKGYWKELHAQVLAYFALMESGDPVLVQSALTERLHPQLKALAGEDAGIYHDLVDGLSLREALADGLHALRPPPGASEGVVSTLMKTVYDERLKLTGQNGLSDYDVGFTNFLWTFSQSATARQDPAQAAV